MNPATWRQVKAIVAEAIAQPQEGRARFLDERCPDPALRDQAATLLKYHDTLSGPPAERATDDLPLGTRIGPYLIIERLGGGGMGEVFLGNDTRLHRKVALKRLLGPASADVRARVLQEARAAARVNHPNVAIIHDVVEDEARAFIVMEYVEGESLADRLRRGPLPIPRVVAFGRQLAAALTAAHARGIVHRDLKPANVQVTPDDSIKVLDFGVAQAVSLATSTSAGATTTRTGAGAVEGGTPQYMAPEQWLGGRVDHRADIYSLGVMLFEMATGRRPHAETDPVDLLLSIAEHSPRADEVDPRVPTPLADVIARALEPDADRRFQSAADLSRALDAALPAEVAMAPAVARISRGRLLAAGAVALVLLVAGVLWVRRAPAPQTGPHPTAVVAVLPFTGDDPQSEESLAAGMAGVLAADLSTTPGVTLVPHASTVKYVRRPYPFAEMRRDLGLDYVVTGAVSRPGDRVGVVMNLIDLKTERTHDRGAFDAKASDVFGLQAQISSWTIERLQALTGDSQAARPNRRPPTADASAFEDYSQGRRFIDRRDLAGNVDRAIDVLEDAVARDPKFALAFAALGEAYWLKYDALKDPQWAERAKDATLEALRLDPDQPMVRYALAIIYRGTGRQTDAIDELRRAIALQPSSDELHRLLGRAYSDRGRLDAAVSEFAIAQRLRPGFWDNYRALGLAYYDAGRYADAVAALRRLTELQPDSATGFQMLGTAFHAMGDLDHALENYRRTNELRPSATAWSNIGTIQYGRKRYAEAAVAYRESLKLQPKEPATLRNLGDALARLGDRTGARQAYRSAVELCEARLAIERKDARLLALEALCLAKIGEAAEARTLIAAALALNPRSPDVLYKKAVIALLGHDTAGALAALRVAIDSGYSRAIAAGDDDLARLAGLPEFGAIVGAAAR